MKIAVTLFALLFISLAFAKSEKNINKFNAAMIESIDRVIEHNPQDYETKPIDINRAPASVEKIEFENIQEEKTDVGHSEI